MKYSATGQDGETIVYADGKRWLWLSGLVLLGVSLTAYGLFLNNPDQPLWLLTPLALSYVVLPLADWLVGEDLSNPPEEIVGDLAEDAHYRTVAYVLVFAQYGFFIATVWLVATQDMPLWAVIALLLGAGFSNGNAINLGHELGHKPDRLNRFMAKLSLALSGYGHFTIEHNRGHHTMVATPEDCASARLGESVYAFALRELPGAFIGGWRQEKKRLAAKGLSLWSWRNDILQVYVATFLITSALVAWLGWAILPFILLHHGLSWFALTLINYIEHYGLLRQKREDGRYQPCEPRHSWNSNHLVSNLMLLHLQRHSDHHVEPMRPYQCLRDFADLPRLPSGYPGCMILASIPSLWFKVMDPKVMDWAGGDISKVNRGLLSPQ